MANQEDGDPNSGVSALAKATSEISNLVAFLFELQMRTGAISPDRLAKMLRDVQRETSNGVVAAAIIDAIRTHLFGRNDTGLGAARARARRSRQRQYRRQFADFQRRF